MRLILGEGDVYASPSGEKLYGTLFFDASTVIWPAEFKGQKAVQLTRKIGVPTDPKTGEIMTEYKGKKLETGGFPYQVLTYWLENGRIRATAEYGVEPNLIKTTSVNGLGWRSMGADTLVVNAPVFINHTMPNGKQLQAWENYDFFLHTPGTIAEPYQLSFVSYYDLPPWAGKGASIRRIRPRSALRCALSLWYAGHVRELMGNTFVAVYAGLVTVQQIALMDDSGTRALPGDVHRVVVMAVAAFQ